MNKSDFILIISVIILLGFILICLCMSFNCKSVPDNEEHISEIIMGQIIFLDDCYIYENQFTYEFYYLRTAQEPIHEKINKKDVWINFDNQSNCILYKKIYVNGKFRCNILWIPDPIFIKLRSET